MTDPTIDKLTELFVSYMRYELNRSPLTVDAYQRDLRQFFDFLASDDTRDIYLQTVTAADIRAWLGKLGRNGATAASLRRKTQSLRAFFHFLCKREIIKANPASEIILAKLPKPLPHFIREQEMESLLDNDINDINGNADPHRQLEHLLLHLLYATGIRRAEAISLTDADISLTRREIRVFGKRRKERVIPIADQLVDEIRRWQQARDAAWPDLVKPAPLLTIGHDRISEATVGRIISRALAATTTDRKSPHTLRHTFATAMLNGGADLDSVRQMLGHASGATTQIYTHLTIGDLKREYSMSHPRQNQPPRQETKKNQSDKNE